VVDQPPSDPSRVYFGAWVTVEDDSGDTTRYRIVGPDEFDLPKGLISMDSPLGKALMRKAIDDEFSVELPTGRKTFVVVAIAYGQHATGDQPC
jgi:transcription elongation factor GreB